MLVTTLTKKMAEDLTEYLKENGIKVRYLHSDIDTLERIEIIRDLRQGVFDVLVGINLLREGLDIPECSLVAILDADKEGFLRSTRSLIQTIGRAARNAEGRVVLFAAGSGNPFFSTDTAVALRAIEMQVDAILMAKNIDGVYTADPHKDPNATLIKDITYQEALQKGLKVMDAAAFALCAENHVPMVRVFGLDVPENLISVLEGSDMGTFVHP